MEPESWRRRLGLGNFLRALMGKPLERHGVLLEYLVNSNFKLCRRNQGHRSRLRFKLWFYHIPDA